MNYAEKEEARALTVAIGELLNDANPEWEIAFAALFSALVSGISAQEGCSPVEACRIIGDRCVVAAAKFRQATQ
jgi:hypothetical protein